MRSAFLSETSILAATISALVLYNFTDFPLHASLFIIVSLYLLATFLVSFSRYTKKIDAELAVAKAKEAAAGVERHKSNWWIVPDFNATTPPKFNTQLSDNKDHFVLPLLLVAEHCMSAPMTLAYTRGFLTNLERKPHEKDVSDHEIATRRDIGLAMITLNAAYFGKPIPPSMVDYNKYFFYMRQRFIFDRAITPDMWKARIASGAYERIRLGDLSLDFIGDSTLVNAVSRELEDMFRVSRRGSFVHFDRFYADRFQLTGEYSELQVKITAMWIMFTQGLSLPDSYVVHDPRLKDIFFPQQ